MRNRTLSAIEKRTVGIWIGGYEIFKRLPPRNCLRVFDNILDHKASLASDFINLISWKALKFRELDLGDKLALVSWVAD